MTLSSYHIKGRYDSLFSTEQPERPGLYVVRDVHGEIKICEVYYCDESKELWISWGSYSQPLNENQEYAWHRCKAVPPTTKGG